MKRLTDYHANKVLGAYMLCSGHCISPSASCFGCRKLDEIVNRLAAYEDILYSGDGTELVTLEDLRGLVTGDDDLRIAPAEWVGATGDPTLYCSACDRSAVRNFWGAYAATKYCPHCGAKMTNGR